MSKIKHLVFAIILVVVKVTSKIDLLQSTTKTNTVTTAF